MCPLISYILVVQYSLRHVASGMHMPVHLSFMKDTKVGANNQTVRLTMHDSAATKSSSWRIMVMIYD